MCANMHDVRLSRSFPVLLQNLPELGPQLLKLTSPASSEFLLVFLKFELAFQLSDYLW